jgi:4-aminobutyrate aminotransferase-like enzyme
MTVQIDEARVEQLTKEQVALLAERWPRSLAFAELAGRSLAGGVSCAWHALDPYTLYGERGEGSKIWDVDGNEYVDLHNGYGVTIVGHAHQVSRPARGPRHALRPADGGLRHRGRAPAAALRSAAVAVQDHGV